MPIMKGVTLVEGSNELMLRRLSEASLKPVLWVADPPWVYTQTGGGDAKKFRSMAKRIYELETLATIARTLACAADRGADDAILALWITTPLKDGIWRGVINPLKEWGVWHYRTSLYWLKTGAPGMGQWIRNDVEELLILTRKASGIPARLKGQMSKRCDRNVFSCARGALEHSEKPLDFERMILERFTLPGELVGSLWSGSFVTGRAAMLTGRECMGAEIDADRREIAYRRMGVE